MGRAVGIAFERNGGHGDRGARGQALLQSLVLSLSVGQPQPPAIVVDHDADVIWIVERGRTAIKRRVVKVPFRGSELPDEFRKVPPVLLVTRAAALRREIVLVPPLVLGTRR